MFCQSCLTSIKAASEGLSFALPGDALLRSSNILHDSLFNLYLSAAEGCWICRQLWELMLEKEDYVMECESDFSEQDGNSAGHEDRFAVEFEILRKSRKGGNSPVELNMYTRDNVLHLTLIATPFCVLELILSPISTDTAVQDVSIRSNHATTSTLANENPELWSHWFRTCSESHERCRGLDHQLQPFVPDRLIEIFTDDDGNSFTWKLACGADSGSVQYLTLSHCWGSSGHTSLTSENYSALLKPNTVSGLPKTFRHAFSITFSLGFRFIWIDSLCIVQDDHKDWKTQASMMGSIYKNACCNIAATWAANGNDGCFTKRESRSITLDLGLGQPTEYHVVPSFLYYDDLVDAPLNTRGWVTQERFLARKQLSFAKSQVYWECRELVASEQFPAGIPSSLWNMSPYNQAKLPTGKPTLDYTTETDRRQSWAALVDFYSNCNFSRLSDRMIGLAGLAEEMRYATQDLYLAGLWRKDLQKQLCWSTDFDVRKRVNRSTIPTYMAPTWSWANVDGPVMSDQRYYLPDMECSSCIEILNASIHSEHPSELHSFVASSLVLRGIGVRARARRGGKSANHDDDDDWELQPTDLNDISNCSIRTDVPVSIMWDENMSDSEVDPERWPNFLEERNSNLLCIFVYIEQSVVTGLLLRRLYSAVNEVAYVRMGVFVNWDKSLSNLLSARLKYPPGHVIVEDINLDDAGLADLVHTVTII